MECMLSYVMRAKRRCNVRDDIENSNSSLMARLVVVLVIVFLVIGAITYGFSAEVRERV
jgi:p-aminobenzoyl-glutamate transporter AbgT